MALVASVRNAENAVVADPDQPVISASPASAQRVVPPGVVGCIAVGCAVRWLTERRKDPHNREGDHNEDRGHDNLASSAPHVCDSSDRRRSDGDGRVAIRSLGVPRAFANVEGLAVRPLRYFDPGSWSKLDHCPVFEFNIRPRQRSPQLDQSLHVGGTGHVGAVRPGNERVDGVEVPVAGDQPGHTARRSRYRRWCPDGYRRSTRTPAAGRCSEPSS